MPISVGPIIQSKSNDPKSMLSDMAAQLDGKGQIKNWMEERTNGELKVGFRSLGIMEKLQSRLGTKSAKARQTQAFTAISDLVSRSNVLNGQQLLANIKNTMERKGKLRGKDIASVIRNFQSNSDQKSTPKGMFVPYGHEFAPRSGGVHLRSDYALDLKAERIIVPRTTATDRGLTPAEEAEVGNLSNSAGHTYVVGMDDQTSGNGGVRKFPDGELLSRYTSVLEKCSGAVVIAPIDNKDQSLIEMLDAALAQCKNNPHLTVTFAIPDNAVRERAQVLYEARQQLSHAGT